MLFGPNGSGKSSVLEAIFFSCLTRSYRTTRDTEAIMRNHDYALVKSKWENLGTVKFTLVRNLGKKLLLNNVSVDRYSDWIGKLPVVILSPEDSVLTHGAPQLKRQYFDRLFSQVSHEYLATLIQYSKLLKQRNAYLKVKNEKKSFAYDIQLETYDEQLAPLSLELYTFRKENFSILNNFFHDFFMAIDERDIPVSIEYKSSIDLSEKNNSYIESFLSESRRNIQNEILLKRSLRGAGYDRIEFKRSSQALKTGASQGEKKFWLVCLKLAEGKYMMQQRGIEPLYLFDDLFSELDIDHTRNLLHHIQKLKEIIVTSTDLSDLRRHGISQSPGSFNIIDI
ncbi:MAG: replication and repair protein RecF [Candidatus Marinimicrobia bacterium]|jgi:DNA replication and repair protein RecF|nr:replication and repair protein RecF [Candidatus Neomarinimicrobiota bacterium]